MKRHGEDRFVIPYHDSKWAVREEGNKRIQKVFDRKQDTVKYARKGAKEANATLTIQKRTGRDSSGYSNEYRIIH